MSQQVAVQRPNASTVLWVGHPWVVPRLIAMTIGIAAFAVIFSYVEFRAGILYLSVASFPLILVTLGALGVVWLIGALSLAIFRATYKYVLRESSLDVGAGILTRKIFTISASGFSDLEVVQGIGGRILNMGTIVMETDSRRDLRLIMIHDPTEVGSKIRQVMTAPMVRIAPEVTPPGGGRK